MSNFIVIIDKLKFMKAKYLVLCVCLIVCGAVSAQGWYPSYAPHGRDIYSSAITNPGNMYTGGGFEVAEEFEEYFHSTDCGLGWDVGSAGGPTSTTVSILFTDSMTGYVVCLNGKVVKTTNAGSNWTA